MTGGAVVMLGYEGRTLEEVLALLEARGVRVLADVRGNPRSRKPGFAAPDLAAALGSRGIAYVPMPALGCDAGERSALWRGGAVEPYRAAYRAHLAEVPAEGARLIALAREGGLAVLCMERDPERCHRAVLAEVLAAEAVECIEAA